MKVGAHALHQLHDVGPVGREDVPEGSFRVGWAMHELPHIPPNPFLFPLVRLLYLAQTQVEGLQECRVAQRDTQQVLHRFLLLALPKLADELLLADHAGRKHRLEILHKRRTHEGDHGAHVGLRVANMSGEQARHPAGRDAVEAV
eukprot:3939682-Rhodomonas_salina.1